MRNSLKNTLKERYGEGIQSTSQLEFVKEKMRANWKNDPEKQKQTCLLRYGSETYNNSELRAQTCLKKYGCENPLQNDNVKEKFKQTCLKKIRM